MIMDNKQKKRLFKLTYLTLFMFVLVLSAIGIYLGIQNILVNNYVYIHYVIIICYTLLLICYVADFFKTDKLQNKYGIGKLLFFIFVVTGILTIVLYITFHVKNLTVLNTTTLAIFLFFICEAITIFAFILGLNLIKLYSNTTITIDSVSETPNYDDELMLKKKLDNLNRKLEMKKVQEQINEIEKELDSKDN